MAAPPPYDKAQEGDQWLWWSNALKLSPLFAAGGFQPPYPPNQGMGHMGHVQAPQTFGQHLTMFYRDPVTTVCPNCRASVSCYISSHSTKTTDHYWQITTSVAIETGTVAWISAGILCAIGLCLCAPIPLCLGSMKVRESNMSTL